jgi:hypothetical protein
VARAVRGTAQRRPRVAGVSARNAAGRRAGVGRGAGGGTPPGASGPPPPEPRRSRTRGGDTPPERRQREPYPSRSALSSTSSST